MRDQIPDQIIELPGILMAKKPRRTFSGRDARQGYIVLKTPLRRAIFISGLAGIVVLAIALLLAS